MCGQPLAIDLFCGLGGWTEGLLAEGYRVVGFDNERHVYGEARYPAQLVIQDVLTLHGRQFKDAALIVASPPCQAYSYRAMPWKKAKALGPPDNSLFEACFRIQREAIEAADHHIPLVVENVCGAQKWVGRARWHYGSFYLWGDVPALMPITKRAKVGGITWTGPNGYGSPNYKAVAFTYTAEVRLREAGIKAGDRNKARASGGHQWTTGFDKHVGNGTKAGKAHTDPTLMQDWGRDHIKQGGDWFNAASLDGDGMQSISRRSGSKSSARRAASAHIAKIPLALSRHIAQAWR